MLLKAIGLLPQKINKINKLSACKKNKIRELAPTVKQGGWGQKFHCDSAIELRSIVRCTFAFCIGVFVWV